MTSVDKGKQSLEGWMDVKEERETESEAAAAQRAFFTSLALTLSVQEWHFGTVEILWMMDDMRGNV